MNLNSLSKDNYTIKREGKTKIEIDKALNNFQHYLKNQKENFLGYQINHNIHHNEILRKFVDMHINNVGDPFIPGDFTMNSKVMEKAILDYYASLWNAKGPFNKEDPESYWGYTLSMGSTEGNVYAIWSARDFLSGQRLLIEEENNEGISHYENLAIESNSFLSESNGVIPIAFYSQDTHYSIKKSMRVLNFQSFYNIGSLKYDCPLNYPEDYPESYSKVSLGVNGWPQEVPSNPDGSIHIPSLVKLIDFFTQLGHPIFICFNYGTTFKGAYDRVEDAINEIKPVLIKNNMYEREISYKYRGEIKTIKRNGFWFHVDGALGSAYMPYLEKAIKEGHISSKSIEDFPIFDFRIPELNSIVMSPHKWIGTPYCCGIFLTKRKYQILPPDNPMYIGSPDTTFAGSRNGFAPIILWEYLARNSDKSLMDKAINCEELASYAEESLKNLEKRLGKNLYVQRSPLAITVRFKQPSKDIIFKYSLSCESTYENNKLIDYAHIYLMDHVKKESIDLLISDLEKYYMNMSDSEI